MPSLSKPGKDTERGAYRLVERERLEASGNEFNDDNVKVDDVLRQDLMVDEDYLESTVLERQLLKKIDRRIMPCLFGMIILNHLDRNSLANARVQGIEASLGLVGSQFNTAISVFFVGYIGLQIPSNLLITRVRPSLYMPGCMIAWGILSGMTALVQDFRGLLIIRFLLGFVEAPFFPGALFLLSSWYSKDELALRTSILYSGSLFSGAFGGFVGATIEYFFHEFLGIASWRWLFIIESTCTVVLAVAAMFILPDYPNNTKFLSQQERAIAVRRTQRKSGIKDEAKGRLLHGLKLAVTDYKVWILGVIIITKTSAGAVTSFIPTLVGTFEYSRVRTLLLVAPPYLFAAAVALTVSWMSDQLSDRAYHIIGPMGFAALGFGIAAATMKLGGRYLALFLMLGGVYGSYNVALAWISSTLPYPVEKRSASIAIINTMGNFAQIYSPYFYLPQNGPRYLLAMVTNVCFCAACIGATMILRRFLIQENRILAAKEMMEDESGSHEDGEDGFRYVL